MIEQLKECLVAINGPSIIKITSVILIMYLGFILRKKFSGIILKIINNTASKALQQYSSILTGPINLIFMILTLYVAVFCITPFLLVLPLFHHIMNSLITIAIFWTVFSIVRPFFSLGTQSKIVTLTEEVKEFLTKLLEIIISLLGFLTVMKIWGIDVATFLAGLGLFGMAIAFAAQDTIKNFFGCIAILTDQTFKKGHWIKTPEVEGFVEKIGFRTTIIRQFDKALVHIPNTKLADTAVINFSKMTNRRVRWIIGLTYDTPADTLSTIVKRIRTFLEKHPEIETDPKRVTTIINVDKFNDSSVDIFCYFFTKSIKWTDYMQIKEDAVLAIKKIVEEEGAAFAFPTKSIHIESSPPNIK